MLESSSASRHGSGKQRAVTNEAEETQRTTRRNGCRARQPHDKGGRDCTLRRTNGREHRGARATSAASARAACRHVSHPFGPCPRPSSTAGSRVAARDSLEDSEWPRKQRGLIPRVSSYCLPEPIFVTGTLSPTARFVLSRER